MKLIVVHFHFRPGGIRRIIELAAPHLVQDSPEPVSELVLAGGEPPDLPWKHGFASALHPCPVRYFIEPAFGYLSEQRGPAGKVRQRVRAGLNRLFGIAGPDCLVWAHNPGIARNLILTGELQAACQRRGVPLVGHHHDWWFDNRWLRWPEMRRFGLRTLRASASAIFPSSRVLIHAGINQADVALLSRRLPNRVFWLPNLTERMPAPEPARTSQAKRWLARKLGEDRPMVWTVPCRLLRRKNLAEALLLARWLRPEAWLICTGKVSSRDEEAYARKLAQAARKRRWKLALSILEGERGAPSVPELLSASEAVLLTSVQEGFGLPFVEAAACERPLIARAIPNIAPDLAQFGFDFPQSYTEILTDRSLFNFEAEAARQRSLFTRFRSSLPARCRPWIGTPVLLGEPDGRRPVPFSRLTLSAQLEVLDQPLERSWELAVKWNPFLRLWKARAAAGELSPTRWPGLATEALGGQAYARRFWTMLARRLPRPPARFRPERLQETFIRQKLGTAHLFPLLWARET